MCEMLIASSYSLPGLQQKAMSMNGYGKSQGRTRSTISDSIERKKKPERKQEVS